MTERSGLPFSPNPTAITNFVSSRHKIRDVVNVVDYYDGKSWADAFRQAFAYGTGVEVPPGVSCTNVNSIISVPAGKDLVIYGSIAGLGGGRFDIPDSCEIFSAGGRLENVGLKLLGGGPRLQGLRMSGREVLAQILIQGTGTYRDLLIDDIVITNANYGILRQGAGSQLRGAKITRGKFQNLRGDAIEWNVCVNDFGVEVVEHDIDMIDNNTSNPNWGIGIGFAGSSYDNTYPDSKMVKNFTIAKIRGRRCRQLIHVEQGKRFEISEITAQEINDTFSVGSNMDSAAIAVYASKNFSIQDVQAYEAERIFIGFGVRKGAYVAAPQDFLITNCMLRNTSLQVNTGNMGSTVRILNNRIMGGSLHVAERPERLIIQGNTVLRNRIHGKAMVLRLDLKIDGRKEFRAQERSLLALRNNIAIDESGVVSLQLEGLSEVTEFLEEGNNF